MVEGDTELCCLRVHHITNVAYTTIMYLEVSRGKYIQVVVIHSA